MPVHTLHMFESSFIKVKHTRYADGVKMHTHSHQKTIISMILGGANHETVHNQTHFGGISQVVIKPAGIPHNNQFSDGCTILSIALQNTNANKVIADHILKDWNWVNGVSCYHYLGKLMAVKTEVEYYRVLNDFMRQLAKHPSPTTFPPQWLIDVKKQLDSRFQEPIQTKELAKEFKVHPVYLARAFRKYFGQSIKAYLKVLRVNGSMFTLINEKEKLVQVAYRNGYADQSHLNRNFKRVTGFTPNEFKTLVQ